MGDGLRTLRLLTNDESLLASTRAAAGSLAGWEFAHVARPSDLESAGPMVGDVILLDGNLRGANVYEICRRLTGRTRARTFVVVEQANALAQPIARFCGATGTLARPLSTEDLRAALETAKKPLPALPSEVRDLARRDKPLPQALLADLARRAEEFGSSVDPTLVDVLTDPETGLFNYAFLNYKLDEEFKRASRFGQPLACAILGFEGQASEIVLRELAAIFLDTSRDTDVIGRFDESSFLFLLPNTGQDGAEVMAKRVGELAQERNLCDLVGDPLQISVGIAFHPHPDVRRREDLYGAARNAFLAARQEGGGVVTAA
jgi:diguanylate cyclase (GGDEF)-like protein